MTRAERGRSLVALAWLGWRQHARRPVGLALALATATFGAALATAGWVARAALDPETAVAGGISLVAVALASTGWWAEVGRERGAERAVLAALGAAAGPRRWAGSLAPAVLLVAGAAIGLLAGARLGGWLLALARVDGQEHGVRVAPGAALAAWLLAAAATTWLLALALELLFVVTAAAARRSRAAPLAVRVATAELARAKRRAALTVAALAVTLAAVSALRAAAPAAARALQARVADAVTWDVRVAAAEAGSRLTLDTLSEVEAIPDVAETAALRRASALSLGRAVPLVALDPGPVGGAGRLRVVDGASGHAPGAARLTEGDVVALSPPLARRLGVGVGDELPLTTAAGERGFRVVALVEAAGGGDAAYLDLEGYAAAFEDRTLDTIFVRLTAGSDVPTVVDRLASRPGGGSVLTATEYSLGVLTAAAARRRAALTVALVAATASAALLLLAVARRSRARRGERSLLAALGAPRAAGGLILGSLAVEVTLAVAAACAVALVLAAALSGYLGAAAPPA